MKPTIRTLAFTALLGLPAVSTAAITELVTNGGFETGDASGWDSFPTATSTFTIVSDSNTGSWAGEISNTDIASAALIKQSNVGVGTVTPGQSITINFSAKGNFGVGGVFFAELFSEVAGGGVSKSEILGGAPLFPNLTTYTDYSFTTTVGPDVSGGVTLQFCTFTGGAAGSSALVILDDVSMTVDAIPEPSALLFGACSALGFATRRRR